MLTNDVYSEPEVGVAQISIRTLPSTNVDNLPGKISTLATLLV